MGTTFKREILIIMYAGLLGILFGAGMTAGRKAIDYIWPDKEVVVKHMVVPTEEDDSEHI